MKTRIIICLAALTLTLSVLFFIYRFCREDLVEINTESIVIDGAYGEEILLKDITAVELVNECPLIRKKLNGFGFFNFQKGLFSTSKGEDINLNFHSKEPPYLMIKSRNSPTWYINFSKQGTTTNSYLELKKTWSLSRDASIKQWERIDSEVTL